MEIFLHSTFVPGILFLISVFCSRVTIKFNVNNTIGDDSPPDLSGEGQEEPSAGAQVEPFKTFRNFVKAKYFAISY